MPNGVIFTSQGIIHQRWGAETRRNPGVSAETETPGLGSEPSPISHVPAAAVASKRGRSTLHPNRGCNTLLL